MIRRLVVVAALLAAACVATPLPDIDSGRRPLGSGGFNRPKHQEAPYLVLVSLDGFKPSYLERFTLPNLQRVVRAGARATHMLPVFPTLTFPNHYSLATGLYPQRHGIVSNAFYDPDLRETYSFNDPRAARDGKWYRGEPIWVTAETQGMVAACFFWPGSEAPVLGIRPTLWKPYDGTVANEERVRAVLEWLRLPTEHRPHFVTLYFSDLDTASHRNSIEAPAVEGAARSLDGAIGALLDGIEGLPFRERVYLVLTSDHGMADVIPSQELALASFVDMSHVEHAFDGPVTSLHIRGGRAEAIAIRDRLNARLTHGRAYLRDEIPERFHYRSDPRAGDVIVVMDESWTLVTGLRRLARPFRVRRGMHGWDPALPSMHALFVAMGPGIRPGTTIQEVQSVDVYPFMAEALGLRPATAIDGQPTRLWRMLGR